MKKTALIIFVLVLFSSCKEDKPNLPAEYDFIKGEWEAYETTVSTTDYHGGYIEHTKTIENIDFRLFFYNDRYVLRRENIDKVYWLESVELENSYDTNVVRFVGPSLRYYYYKNEDIIYSISGLDFLFHEIPYSEILGGHTLYRRVQ
jgi:hypothetical protein